MPTPIPSHQKPKRINPHLPFSHLFKQVYHEKVVGYSPEFARFYKKHKKDIRSSYALINRKLEELKAMPRGATIIFRGVKITKEHTGSYKGSNNVLTLKIDIKDKEFFVRLEPESAAHNSELVFETVNGFLNDNNYSFGEYTVHAMKPHVFIRTSNGEHVISVTDFHHPNEVTLGVDLPKEHQVQIKPLVNHLGRKLAFKGIIDVGLHNIFYDPARKRILLFDLKMAL